MDVRLVYIFNRDQEKYLTDNKSVDYNRCYGRVWISVHMLWSCFRIVRVTISVRVVADLVVLDVLVFVMLLIVMVLFSGFSLHQYFMSEVST